MKRSSALCKRQRDTRLRMTIDMGERELEEVQGVLGVLVPLVLEAVRVQQAPEIANKAQRLKRLSKHNYRVK